MKLSQLEEDQSNILVYYDPISDLLLSGSMKPCIKFSITRTNVLFFGHLVDSRVGTPFFAGHTYAVVSLRGNE